MWTSGKVETNGLQLHYHRGGDGPPLILLHGLTDNGLCWTPVAKQLAHRYDVIMPDARGHGGSDKPEVGYHPKDHATDVIGLIEALEIQNPILMGHSMGGDNAFVTAGLLPDGVRAVIMEDPPWNTEDGEVNRSIDIAAWREDVIRNKSRTREDLMQVHADAWQADELGPWADSKLSVSPNALDYALNRANYWRTVRNNVTCPALLITADNDLGAIVKPEVAQDVMQHNPNIQVAHIPHAGHSIRRDQFDQYMQAVNRFLDSL